VGARVARAVHLRLAEHPGKAEGRHFLGDRARRRSQRAESERRGASRRSNRSEALWSGGLREVYIYRLDGLQKRRIAGATGGEPDAK
jgi:hypothetical protein